MSERVVKIKLETDASGAVQGFAATRDAAGELKAKVAESARSQRAEWATIGTGLTAVGVAVTGVGVAALKTGIQYNTLQQTTRAALTSLLGGAKAANAQMDKLDEFARNSPFSKATFIKAQQQMLAFGIETKKVIPYLDGVQNAVAAAGGSNADIEGIVATMSKIQSSSKITATDLMEFGNRGVNAADLIGSQMGKTGAQIREDITAGTLSAEKALDSLAKGMSETYAGAADNVKNTFAGSMDRVKAAWRDFSAELAKPLVDPNGGGALVDFLNGIADAMRNFEKLPEPIKLTTSALVGLIGVSALVAGAAILAVPKWVAFKDALASFPEVTGKVKSGLAGLGPAALAVGLAFASAHIADAIADYREAKIASDDLAKSLKKTGDVNGDLTRGFSSSNPFASLTDGSVVAEANLKQLSTGVGQLRANFETTFVGKALSVPFLGFGRDLGQAKEQIEEFDGALAALVESGRTEDAAKGFDQFAAMAKKAGWEQSAITDALPEYASAQENAAEAAKESGDASKSAAEWYTEQAQAAKAVTDGILGYIDALNELNGVGRSAEKTNAALQSSAENIWEYISKAQEGVEGYVFSLDEWTAAGSANRAMLADHAAQVEADAKAQFELEVKTLGAAAATDNFQARMSSGRQAVYDMAFALTGSAEEAQKLTNKFLEMPDQKAIDILLTGAEDAMTKADTVRGKLALIPSVIPVNIAVTESLIYSEEGLKKKYGGAATGGIIGYAHGGVVGYAGGGILPGYDPVKRDTILTPMRRGEGVLVPEVVRGLGPSTVHALNAAGNSGGVSAVRALMAPEAPPMTAASFAPSVVVQQPQVINNTVVQAPTELTVVDAKGALIGKMQVVANEAVDTFVAQSAQANRRAGY